MKYPEHKNPNYAQVADEVRAFWQEHAIFRQSVERREGQPTFTFYEGPPSANGTPGIHHVMARTIKDIFCRYKTLKGYQVKRKGGWDTHGLPVELQVEKQLGITKEDIGDKISIEEYNQRCREAVMKFKGEWDELTRQMGYWVDLDDPYITFERNYMETLWHLLKRFYDEGLLYKGYTIQPYSPAAGTGLSSHELNMPGTYKDVKDTSIVAQFKLADRENDYLLAWTTTPWTLPANSGIAVGANIDYVKVSTFNPYTYAPVNVILAKDRMDSYFNPKAKDLKLVDYQPGDKLIPYEVVETTTGRDLDGLRYEQLLPYVPLPDPAFTVVLGDFVTTEDGTGLVHLAKTFGADDFRTLEKYGMPGVMVQDENGNEVPIVNKQGRFVNGNHRLRRDAGQELRRRRRIGSRITSRPTSRLPSSSSRRTRPFGWNATSTPIPTAGARISRCCTTRWSRGLLSTTARKDRLVELNKTINWKPESTGTGRFGNWLENLVDWNLSRSRYWGTPAAHLAHRRRFARRSASARWPS